MNRLDSSSDGALSYLVKYVDVTTCRYIDRCSDIEKLAVPSLQLHSSSWNMWKIRDYNKDESRMVLTLQFSWSMYLCRTNHPFTVELQILVLLLL